MITSDVKGSYVTKIKLVIIAFVLVLTSFVGVLQGNAQTPIEEGFFTFVPKSDTEVMLVAIDDSVGTELVIPDEVQGYKVVEIVTTLRNEGFTSVKLPKYLKEIPASFLE